MCTKSLLCYFFFNLRSIKKTFKFIEKKSHSLCRLLRFLKKIALCLYILKELNYLLEYAFFLLSTAQLAGMLNKEIPILVWNHPKRNCGVATGKVHFISQYGARSFNWTVKEALFYTTRIKKIVTLKEKRKRERWEERKYVLQNKLHC